MDNANVQAEAVETVAADTEVVAEATEATEATAEVATEAPAQEKRPYRQNNTRGRRKKVCLFCTEKTAVIDYKDALKLRKFTSERGKILPRRVSGACAKHQRELTVAIKRARVIALLPYVTD